MLRVLTPQESGACFLLPRPSGQDTWEILRYPWVGGHILDPLRPQVYLAQALPS